jgi:hypothetical protein
VQQVMGKKKRLRETKAKKQRTTSIVLDMGHPVALRSATYSSDGRISVATEQGPVTPAQAWVETTYPRPKGEKVINRIEVPATALAFSPELAIAQYECVFAVDTNRPRPEESVTFTRVVQAQIREIGPNLYRSGILRDLVIELHNVEYSAERFGWWLVIASVINRPPGKLIAILVDAYLSEIPAINRREQPVLGKNFLPEGFQLIYASSDKATDSIANKLLRRADQNAREIADIYQRPDVVKPPLVTTAEGGVLSHMRTWEKHGPAA